MKTVNIDVEKFIENTDKSIIASLYEKLGWDKSKYKLDPKKVVMNREDALRAVEAYCNKSENKDEKQYKMYEWFNCGPSSRDTVKKNQVKLYKGWLIPIK